MHLLAQKIPPVKALHQPYSSFDGVPKEQSESFYLRVSERLRHKRRAITIWDYEHLVLEKFPAIYKVKCLNHINNEAAISPGSVTLSVIPNLRNQNAIDPLEPKVNISTLYAIENYLKGLSSPYVEIAVKNPIYEQLLVDFKVVFHAGYDEGYHKQVLNEEITKFLSPWAFEEGEDIIFGSKAYKSTILGFIEDQPYVDFVSEFKLYHIGSGTLPASETITALDHSTLEVLLLHNQDTAIKITVLFDKIAEAPIDSYRDNLLQDIRTYLNDPIINKGRMHRTAILNYIEKRPYIKELQELRLFHYASPGKLKEDTEVAIAGTTSATILVSAPKHDIEILDAASHTCEGIDELGVGYMTVDYDFDVT